MRDGGMAAADHRHHVDAERGLPARLVIGMAESRGVVDENVEPAQRCDGLGHIGLDRLGLGEVERGGMGGDAVRLDLAPRRLQRPGVRAQIETAAPPAAKPSAMERPIPRLPPITTTCLPANSFVMTRVSLAWQARAGMKATSASPMV